MESVGTLYVWKVSLHDSVFSTGHTDLETALVWYEKAVDLRPHSARSWVNILNVKSRLGQVDELFSAALNHAADYGVHQAYVQQGLIESGLRNWRQLSFNDQQRVLLPVQQGFESEPARVITLLDRNRLKSDLCGLLLRSVAVESYCTAKS